MRLLDLGNAKLQGLEETLIPNDESGDKFALLSAMFCESFQGLFKHHPTNNTIQILHIFAGVRTSKFIPCDTCLRSNVYRNSPHPEREAIRKYFCHLSDIHTY